MVSSERVIGGKLKNIRLILDEIDRHFDLLNYEEEKLIKRLPLKKEYFEDYEFLVLLDAFIFRFIKVQSSIGEKLFPIFFEVLTGKPYTEVSFIDILNTLEKYSFLKSADKWNRIRKLRNEFVHIYPWETEQKMEAVKEALDMLLFIKETYKKIKEYVVEKGF